MTILRTLKTAAAAALLGLGLASGAAAQGTPSAKATFAYSPLISLPACSNTSAGACNSVADDSDWRTILRQQIKMANQKDLFFNASLQCGIVTDTTVKSMNGSLDSAEARATIRVRVKVTNAAGASAYAQPNLGVDANGEVGNPLVDTDGIVFCDRIQQLRAKFSGLNCTADLMSGAVTCAAPEELQLILKTLNANAFNFVAANLASGVYTVEVQARSTAATGSSGTNGSLGAANAFIGAGSVAVEAVRMIKGNTGATLEF